MGNRRGRAAVLSQHGFSCDCEGCSLRFELAYSLFSLSKLPAESSLGCPRLEQASEDQLDQAEPGFGQIRGRVHSERRQQQRQHPLSWPQAM